MAKRKGKKRTALPRLTLLAYSREELVGFTEAVARLRGIADDLMIVQAQLALLARSGKGGRKAKTPQVRLGSADDGGSDPGEGK